MASSEQNFKYDYFPQLSQVNEYQQVKRKQILQLSQYKKQQISSSDGQSEHQHQQSKQKKQLYKHDDTVSSAQNIKEYFDELFPQYQHQKLSTINLSTKTQLKSQKIQFFHFQTVLNLPLIQKKILQSGLFLKTQQFTNQLLILKTYHTKYYEVISLQIQLSFYKTKIHILNNRLPSQIHNVAYFQGFGGFGNVHFCKFQHQEYAIKCIHFGNKIQNQQKMFEDKKNSLISTLKEYFFILLFSQLQIGPKVKKIFGFDLIIYEGCIEFSTQICQKRKLGEDGMMDLKESLKKMHMLQFVHRDIKPGNIIYSPTFRKYVFIDFGSCSCLSESFGQKTLTNFIGTAGFCTPQLINLIGRKGIVDLYFNDVYGLKKTFSTNLNDVMYKDGTYKIQLKNIQNPYFQLNLIKYQIFNQKYQQFSNQWRRFEKHHLDHLQQAQFLLMEFLIDFPPHEMLASFYWNQTTQRVRNFQEFVDLKKTFSLKINDSLWAWKLDSYKQKQFKQLSLFYNYFLNQFRPYNKLEKQILKTLQSKKNIEHFIFSSLKDFQKLQLKQTQAMTPKESLVIYFLVVVNYTTFVQNQYNCSFQNKVKASRIANKMIQNLNDNEFFKMEPLFQPYQSECQPLIKMFQYFIFYLLNKVPEKFKQKSMTNSYSSLLLLGFPVYLPYENGLILFQFIKEHEKNRIQAILTFWQSILISIHFGNILINRKNKPRQTSFQQKQKIIDEEIEKVFSPDQNQQSSFFNLNHYFFVNLYANQKKLKAKNLQEASQKLNQPHSFQNISQQNYQRWKNMMIFNLRLLNTIFYQKFIFSVLNSFKFINYKNIS